MQKNRTRFELHRSMTMGLAAMMAACAPPQAGGDSEVVASAATLAGGALLVVNKTTTTLNGNDTAIKNHLTALGFTVVVKSAEATAAADAAGKALVVISESVTTTSVNTKLRDVPAPVVCLESGIFDDMGLTGPTMGTDFGEETTESQLVIETSHPMAVAPTVTVTSSAQTFGWGKPGPGAVVIASLKGSPARVAIFGYDAGQTMVGLVAPARRVGMFAGKNTPGALNAYGWKLFDAALSWASTTPPAALAISPPLGSYGAIAVGASTPPTTFTVTNNGASSSGALTVSVAGLSFVIAANTCLSPLAPGQSCSTQVFFKPTAVGAASGTLTVAAAPGGTVTAALAGTGKPAGALAVTPSLVDFGTIGVEQRSEAIIVGISNLGAVATGPVNLQVTGAGFYPNAHSCYAPLPPNGVCYASVYLKPTAIGPASGALTISGTQGETVVATLAGIGGAPAQLAVTPASFDFGSVTAGAQSSIVEFTVTNVGGSNAGYVGWGWNGTSNAFPLWTHTCNSPLQAGESCKAAIIFAPTEPGLQELTYVLYTGTLGDTLTLPLTGTGL
jgi:hypothetical protein